MKWIDAIDKDYTIRRKFRKQFFFYHLINAYS